MGRVILNAVLLLALLGAAGLAWMRSDAAKTNYELFPDMAHSVRSNAFAPNANLAAGQTLQAPPAGAIPRGYLPLHYAATPQDAARAGEELISPDAPGNERALQRGAQVFANFCSECHGAAAAGNGPVAQRGYPPPPSLLAEHAVKMKDGQLFHILTYGQNNMPSYASQLSRQDRWDAIFYVRSLQAAAPPASAAVSGGKP
ncbi:MAG TPA: cytochrome c [Terriglobales bacterium]|nr:cytochrome c [Terriglobales bacterium]